MQTALGHVGPKCFRIQTGIRVVLHFARKRRVIRRGAGMLEKFREVGSSAAFAISGLTFFASAPIGRSGFSPELVLLNFRPRRRTKSSGPVPPPSGGGERAEVQLFDHRRIVETCVAPPSRSRAYAARCRRASRSLSIISDRGIVSSGSLTSAISSVPICVTSSWIEPRISSN